MEPRALARAGHNGVARFFTGFDAFLTPAMSTPPLPVGTMVSTPQDPWRSLEVSSQTVRYAVVIANLTGNPAMSLPLWWNDDGLPIGVHFLGRFGGEATLIRLAAQLEAAQRGPAAGPPCTRPGRWSSGELATRRPRCPRPTASYAMGRLRCGPARGAGASRRAQLCRFGGE